MFDSFEKYSINKIFDYFVIKHSYILNRIESQESIGKLYEEEARENTSMK